MNEANSIDLSLSNSSQESQSSHSIMNRGVSQLSRYAERLSGCGRRVATLQCSIAGVGPRPVATCLTVQQRGKASHAKLDKKNSVSGKGQVQQRPNQMRQQQKQQKQKKHEPHESQDRRQEWEPAAVSFPEQTSPWSGPIYALTLGLICGSLYYAHSKSNERIDPLAESLAEEDQRAAAAAASAYSDPDIEKERAVLSLTQTLWSRLRNLWHYPREVRKALRTALYYHLYSSAADAATAAEAAYLVAWNAAKDDHATSLAVVAGLALQIAAFYAEMDRPRLAAQWYSEGLQQLAAWYLGGTEMGMRQPVQWNSPEGRDRLERVAAILAETGRMMAAVEANPDAPQASPGSESSPVAKIQLQRAGRYFANALALLMVDSRDKAQVVAQLERSVRGEPPMRMKPADQNAAVPAPRPGPFLALLEDMATYHAQRNEPEMVVALRRMQLMHMPVPKGMAADPRDAYCRRALVMNNLADAYVALAHRQKGIPKETKASGKEGEATDACNAKLAFLKNAEAWLLRSLQATEAGSTAECGLCRAAAFNNLGIVNEDRADILARKGEEVTAKDEALIAAARYFRGAVQLARQLTEVDARREAQSNLKRVQDKIAGGNSKN